MTKDEFLNLIKVNVSGDDQKDFLRGLREYEDAHIFYSLMSIYFEGDTVWESFENNVKHYMKEYGEWWYAPFHKQFRQVDMFDLPRIGKDGINGHLDSIMWECMSNDLTNMFRRYMERFFEHTF